MVDLVDFSDVSVGFPQLVSCREVDVVVAGSQWRTMTDNR